MGLSSEKVIIFEKVKTQYKENLKLGAIKSNAIIRIIRYF